MYGSKKKKKVVKMKGKECKDCSEVGQHEVPKRVEQSKKIKPKEVFGSNYKSKKKK